MALKRNKISDEVLSQMIGELLDQGERGATNFYELLRTKVQISKQRCLKMYPIVEKEWVELKDKVINEQREAEIAEAARSGLKTDLELEQILCQFASNNLEVEEWVKGKVILRGISPLESIQAIAQIFKKRGSYAPIKTANTDKDGNNAPPIMSDSQFEKYLTAINDKAKAG